MTALDGPHWGELLDDIDAGIILFRNRDNIFSLNHYALQILDINPEDPESQRWQEVPESNFPFLNQEAMEFSVNLEDLARNIVTSQKQQLDISVWYHNKKQKIKWLKLSGRARHHPESTTEPYYDAIITVIDITEQKQKEQEIVERESLLDSIINNAHEGITLASPAGDYTVVNQAMAELTGYDSAELLRMNVRDLVPEETDLVLFRRVINSGRDGEREVFLRKRDGSTFLAHIHGTPLRNEKDSYVLGFIRDITEERKTEMALKESEERYRTLSSLALDGILLHENGTFIDCNEAFTRMFGYSVSELEKLDMVQVLIPEEYRGEIQNKIKAHFAGNYEIEMLRKDGKRIPVDLNTRVISVRDRSIRVVTITDLTERKNNESILKDALAEKETLLRELYHRTKNNMYVISAYLQLQMMNADDPETRRVLTDIDTRIQTMALVNQKLYASRNLTHINLQEYLIDLIGMIRSSYSRPGQSITIDAEIQEISVSIDVAMPLGLVVNEIITNSFKHGFINKKSGKLILTMGCESNGDLSIMICDDGPGLMQDLEDSKDTIGIPTIMGIVKEQLQGELHYSQEDGFCWHIFVKSDLYGTRVSQ